MARAPNFEDKIKEFVLWESMQYLKWHNATKAFSITRNPYIPEVPLFLDTEDCVVIKPKIDPWSGYYSKQQVDKSALEQFFSNQNNSNHRIPINKYKVGGSNYRYIWQHISSLGEGMALTRQIILQNGDTEDWVRLDFETFSNEGKIILGLIKATLDSKAKMFDFKRKCWFISKDVIEPLLKGIKALISNKVLSGYYLTDERVFIESFDDFFTEEAKTGLVAQEKAPRVVLIKQMEDICKNYANVMVSIREDVSIDELKKTYRKAALALHPDRNNGDSSKMADLNLVWGQLQEYK